MQLEGAFCGLPVKMSSLVTHIRDCSATFDRIRVHWSIRAEVRLFARHSMNYKNTNWFKPDMIW